MNFSEYQERALRSDKTQTSPNISDDEARLIPLLGLAGEAGQLLSEYKKRLRDGPGHVQFVERVAEELGDILWYVSNVATKYDLSLDAIAQQNLSKVSLLYHLQPPDAAFDADRLASERFPRRFTARFIEVKEGARAQVRIEIDGALVGAALTDNSYEDDGYRYHDVFHIAYAAILGWSPVLRSLLRLKRQSTPLVDEVEDGGRAAVIEEGIVAATFDYARRHHFLRAVTDVDESLLSTLHGMSAHLEVSTQPPSSWRQAVMEGFAVWRELVQNSGGYVMADLDCRTIRYLGPPESAIATAAAAKGE